MRAAGLGWYLVSAGALVGCAARPAPVADPAPAPSAPAATSSAAPVAAPPPGPEAPAAPVFAECGALDCRLFDSPAAAFEAVVSSDPLVLGVGEAHAQQAAPSVPSATRRFAEQLLPLLEGRASHLVVELWTSRGDCGGGREQAVAERQAPVTAPQAATNLSEFVALGSRAKQLGIAPHALEPSCDEYDRILRAGEADIAEMLAAIARTTTRTIDSLRERGAPGMIVAYGGAVHNDVAPRPGREAWSFGPEQARKTGDRYVELDLIVPEFIKDTEVWRGLPWYAHFDKARHPGKTTLYRPAPGSFVLIFPESPRP